MPRQDLSKESIRNSSAASSELSWALPLCVASGAFECLEEGKAEPRRCWRRAEASAGCFAGRCSAQDAATAFRDFQGFRAAKGYLKFEGTRSASVQGGIAELQSVGDTQSLAAKIALLLDALGGQLLPTRRVAANLKPQNPQSPTKPTLEPGRTPKEKHTIPAFSRGSGGQSPPRRSLCPRPGSPGPLQCLEPETYYRSRSL